MTLVLAAKAENKKTTAAQLFKLAEEKLEQSIRSFSSNIDCQFQLGKLYQIRSKEEGQKYAEKAMETFREVSWRQNVSLQPLHSAISQNGKVVTTHFGAKLMDLDTQVRSKASQCMDGDW